MKIQYLKLIISIVICQLAGFIGSFFTRSSVSTWYMDLNKPSFNPPNWVFAPVWTLLYLLMGISMYLIWIKMDNPIAKKALIVFGIQLFLNIMWSVLFFGLHNPFFAFIEIIGLLIMILAAMILSYKVSPWAAYLLVPYILWVSFAAVLNFSIFKLNM